MVEDGKSTQLADAVKAAKAGLYGNEFLSIDIHQLMQHKAEGDAIAKKRGDRLLDKLIEQEIDPVLMLSSREMKRQGLIHDVKSADGQAADKRRGDAIKYLANGVIAGNCIDEAYAKSMNQKQTNELIKTELESWIPDIERHLAGDKLSPSKEVVVKTILSDANVILQNIRRGLINHYEQKQREAEGKSAKRSDYEVMSDWLDRKMDFAGKMKNEDRSFEVMQWVERGRELNDQGMFNNAETKDPKES
jgi:hypothetical protein